MAKKSADKAADETLMTLPELAVYLHLDEKTVYKLVTQGKLPSVGGDRQWHFRRREVDGWLERELLGEDETFVDVPDGMKLPLEDLLPDSAIIIDLKARTPVAVIEELAARAYGNNWLTDKPWFVGAVVERESLSSTAMEGGVAFLHTRAKDKGKIVRPFLIVGRSWEGIEFGAPDGRRTFLFFLMGLKYDKLHLPILGRLARALRNPQTIAKLRALSSPDKLRALLLREDESARLGVGPEVQHAPFVPKLDKQMRLRAMRRLQQTRVNEAAELLAPKKKPRSKTPRVPKVPKLAPSPAATGGAAAVATAPAKPAVAAKPAAAKPAPAKK
jgi:excisionase family DNA binding protein